MDLYTLSATEATRGIREGCFSCVALAMEQLADLVSYLELWPSVIPPFLVDLFYPLNGMYSRRIRLAFQPKNLPGPFKLKLH